MFEQCCNAPFAGKNMQKYANICKNTDLQTG